MNMVSIKLPVIVEVPSDPSLQPVVQGGDWGYFVSSTIHTQYSET